MGSSTNIPDGRPLRERDGAIINQWYIACLSKDLGQEPLARTLYDIQMVLFRDKAGKPAVLVDRCMHRGTLLSKGKCIDGHLRCPYHGWTFDSVGKVVDIPSEGGATTKNFKHKGFKCVEQDSVIWVYTGDDEPTSGPSWRFPQIDHKEWTSYFMVTDFNNEVTNLAENFMDVPHTVYVHDKWFRKKSHIKVPVLVEMKNGRVLCTYNQENDKIGFASWILNPHKDKMIHTDEFIFPNITRVDYLFGENGFIINSQMTPISSMQTKVYTYIAFRISWWSRFFSFITTPLMNYYTRKVIQQDVDIMDIQNKGLTSGHQPPFQSTEADELHLYVERLRELGVKGDPSVLTLARSKEREFWI